MTRGKKAVVTHGFGIMEGQTRGEKVSKTFTYQVYFFRELRTCWKFQFQSRAFYLVE